MKTMNFQDDISSILFSFFKDHFNLVLDLISVQDTTENCHYREPVGELLTLELNFTFPLKHVTEPVLLGERKFLIAVEKFAVVGENI